MAASSPGGLAYRWEAFKHWANLSFLGASALVATVDPKVGLIALGLEVGLLWILPDVPKFKAWVDTMHAQKKLLDERAFFLDKLFGLHARKDERGLLARLFVESHETNDDIDARIQSRRSEACTHYLEMRDIVRKISELTSVRGVRIGERDVERLELSINGYLRLLLACDPIAQAVDALDPRELQRDLERIDEEMESAPAPMRTALGERRRLAQGHLDRLPKLEATLQLFRARAEAIVHHLRQLHGQVLADPGLDVTSALNDMIERQEILTDPLGQLAADQVVQEFLRKPSAHVDTLREKRAAGQTAPRARQKQ